MSFQSDMDRIRKKVKSRERALYNNVRDHAFRSIRFGSPVTGAPGQPVDKGDLLKSYKVKRLGSRRDEISSPLSYAPIIEDNRRGAQLRSKVGGFHSIKMTRIGWRRIVEYEMKKLKMSDGSGPSVALTGRTRDARGRFTGNESGITTSG